jgi:hypothetical protein
MATVVMLSQPETIFNLVLLLRRERRCGWQKNIAPIRMVAIGKTATALIRVYYNPHMGCLMVING